MKLTIAREEFHQRIYFFGLALLVCSLPLSRFLLSISQILLVLNWFARNRFREKVAAMARTPSILLVAAVFLIYVAGLLYTRHLDAGAARIKNALPLLLLPIVMGTSLPLSDRHFKWLLLLFSAAVTTATLVCLIRYLIIGAPAGGDFRKISIFMLHIRFSLLIVMAVFILLYLSFYESISSSKSERTGYFLGACYLITFLFFLRSLTGIIIFGVLATVFMLKTAARSKWSIIRFTAPLMITGFILALMAYPVFTYLNNFHAKPVRLSALGKIYRKR